MNEKLETGNWKFGSANVEQLLRLSLSASPNFQFLISYFRFMLKVAINGFGRIGRAAFRIILERQDMQVVAINDLGDVKNLAYLLKYDSVYRRFDRAVEARDKGLSVGGKMFQFYSIAEAEKLPWGKLGVDVVLECSGAMTTQEAAELHLKAGAKKVLISAPTKSEGVVTAVRGVNEEKIKGQNIVANASCTTNCVAPIMAVLDEAFGVEKSLLTTVHAMTASQRTVDSVNPKDWREGRAASANMIPSTTGAAIATALVLPQLENKFDGIAVRVPVLCGSLSDIVAVLKKNVTVEQVNGAFTKAAKDKRFNGILETTEDELVSADILGTTASAIVDLKFTKVVDGNLVKVLAWYDNEWAYANRLVEMAERMG